MKDIVSNFYFSRLQVSMLILINDYILYDYKKKHVTNKLIYKAETDSQT